MFKLVVLSALVAVAVAKPSGYLHGALEVAPIVAQTYVAPAAVSSTYREDIISKPAAVAYAAPVVTKSILAEPVHVAAPVVAKTVITPAAVSHTYREDIISKPSVVAYAAPTYVEQAVVAEPVAKAVVAEPIVAKAVVAEPIVTKAVVAEPVVTKAVVAEPIAVAAPVVAKTIVSPAAVSHTYREDIISKPTALAYAAPAVSYSAPAIAYAAPALAYSSVAYSAPNVAYAGPVFQKTVVAAPTVYSAPVAHAYAHSPAVYAAQAPIVQAW